MLQWLERKGGGEGGGGERKANINSKQFKKEKKKVNTLSTRMVSNIIRAIHYKPNNHDKRRTMLDSQAVVSCWSLIPVGKTHSGFYVLKF